MVERGFTLREHTSEVAVEATGQSLGEAFAATADGMAAVASESVPDGGDRFEIEVVAEDEEALLYDYLAELLYERDVRDVLPVENEATVQTDDGEWRLSGSARGVPLDALSALEVKAPTYSEMSVAEVDGGWRVYVVLDV